MLAFGQYFFCLSLARDVYAACEGTKDCKAPISVDDFLLVQRHALQSVETPPAEEDLLLGVHHLVNSQSQIANEIASKIVEFKANADKADSSHRKSLDEAKALYQGKLTEQHMNTTRLRDMNKRLEQDIKDLVSSNAELRQQAQELKKQSLALQVQVTAAETNLTLAQEYTAKSVFDDSNDDLKFLNDLRSNESEAAKAQAHTSAVDEFDTMTLLQLGNDTESLQLLHTVENTFSELSAQANASKIALEKSFEQSFSQEAMVQEAVLAKQQALLDEKQKQLAVHSKLTDAVAHALKTKTYLSNRILHLRSFALKLSGQ